MDERIIRLLRVLLALAENLDIITNNQVTSVFQWRSELCHFQLFVIFDTSCCDLRVHICQIGGIFSVVTFKVAWFF